jgi:hypothetical protein
VVKNEKRTKNHGKDVGASMKMKRERANKNETGSTGHYWRGFSQFI